MLKTGLGAEAQAGHIWALKVELDAFPTASVARGAACVHSVRKTTAENPDAFLKAGWRPVMLPGSEEPR